MNARNYLIILTLITLISCQKQQELPWSNLTWLHPGHSEILVKNTSTITKSINISYFNKTTREVLDSTIQIQPNSVHSVGLEIFRPEIIKINYEEVGQTTYLLPEKNLELEINNTIQISGKHKNVYTTLFEVSDNTKTIAELEAYFEQVNPPDWLISFLLKSREYKESYDIYHQAGYQVFIGNTDMTVEPIDSIQAEKLLADPIVGMLYYYYSLLQVNKYNFELRKKNENLQNEFYKLRMNLFNKLEMIHDEKTRYNTIAMFTEGLMLRKRREFKDKDVLYTEIIGLLPEEYVDKLNKIEKEYIINDYDTAAITDLLSKTLKSGTGMTSPLNDHNKEYKLLKFWFAGCAPCKKQIPHENKLLEKYGNLSILHFCKSTSEEHWREYISDNKSNGDHYYLDQEMTMMYKSVFKLSYSPRYVLLNRGNEVICWNCANPSDNKLEELLAVNDSNY